MTAKSLIMGTRTTLLVYQGKVTAKSLVTKGNWLRRALEYDKLYQYIKIR